MSIHEHRTHIRRLLDDSSPADAPTAYFALFHNPARSALYTLDNGAGDVTGFIGVFQTGIDLFRPLVTLVCPDPECAAALLHRALTPNRSYIFFAKMNQFPLVGGSLRVDHHRTLQIYQLDTRRFQPEVNVLVRRNTAHDGTARAVIEAHGIRATAGVNWQSPAFAELFVHVDPGARQRGWGKHVVTAVTQMVLEGGRIPLYLVESDNEVSRHIAESLGYVDTGARQVYADVVYTGHPGE
ncbi:MAG: GNAT family N-acetyltransferase [Anaerolineae bacterium]|nr:GNAT family N-acetyltransferase [Anaerolineae bacterium]